MNTKQLRKLRSIQASGRGLTPAQTLQLKKLEAEESNQFVQQMSTEMRMPEVTRDLSTEEHFDSEPFDQD